MFKQACGSLIRLVKCIDFLLFKDSLDKESFSADFNMDLKKLFFDREGYRGRRFNKGGGGGRENWSFHNHHHAFSSLFVAYQA